MDGKPETEKRIVLINKFFVIIIIRKVIYIFGKPHWQPSCVLSSLSQTLMSAGHVKYIKDCESTSGLCETLDFGAERRLWPGTSCADSWFLFETGSSG